MSIGVKSQAEILNKLGIQKLNAMQNNAFKTIVNNDNVVLLSPTGTGKTLAFLLPIVANLDSTISGVQALIVAPTRELAIQIEQVIRDMGTGFKTNVVYGGRKASLDRINIQHRPAILVGTPGRVADHLRREAFEVDDIKTIVLDEFDKSLEIGFEDDMIEILGGLPNIKQRILTSATNELDIPVYLGMTNHEELNYLGNASSKLEIKMIYSEEKDKLNSLLQSLQHIGNKPGIIFCNFKDSIQRISDFLYENKVPHGCFYGGLEQRDRERALIKFRNGSHQLLLATDLAARGIDVPEIGFILHYQLPNRVEEFTHRNGRTARMNSDGTAYILHHRESDLPEYMDVYPEEVIASKGGLKTTDWTTLFVSGGKKDKISKGDIAGMFMKQAGLKPYQVGVIELKLDCAFVGVHKQAVKMAIKKTNNTRLKKKKVRVQEI